MKGPQYYYVTHQEVAIMTDYVWADSQADAIRKVQDGGGERVGFDIDEKRMPTTWKATPEQ